MPLEGLGELDAGTPFVTCILNVLSWIVLAANKYRNISQF